MNDTLYKFLISCASATNTYQMGKVYELDEELIQDLLNANYIKEYDGTIEITENGTYDVIEYESADVNVSGGGDNNAKFTNPVSADNNTFIKNIVETDEIIIPDTLTTMTSFFSNCKSLTNIRLSNTGHVTDMSNMFNGCETITTIPLIDTSSVINMATMFKNCTSLVSVPILDTSKLASRNSFNGMFTNCNSLSNDSLNNILLMCANATTYNKSEYYKTLSNLGLSSTQATICQGLSNWEAFTTAGWSTGY